MQKERQLSCGQITNNKIITERERIWPFEEKKQTDLLEKGFHFGY